ncbi:zinc finger protein 300-like [Ylistrum balloti]|uniref:zinc finger protein 300-like n=1 Tax=Ylistrum balloti TaxID=509963 RepID=UPI002905921E|nr:zinc finger protein 300-like [Ylistrum balloti]
MVIFSRVTGAISSDFVAKFPQHFNFIEMLESVCEETGTRIMNQGNNNFEIVGDWSQMTFVHSMLENTMAIYGAVAMVSSAYPPAKDLKIAHNKRMTPDTNDPIVRDGHGGMRDQTDMGDNSYTSGNQANRYYDSRVGPYPAGNNGDRFFDSRGSHYTPSTTGNRTFDNRGWYFYPGNMTDRVHDPRAASYMPTNNGDKFYDSRSGPYTHGYSAERHYDPRMGPYTQNNMMDRHFDNRERSYTPGNIADRPYNSNIGLQSTNMNDKNPLNVTNSLELPPLAASSTPTGGSIEGTINRLESTANIAAGSLTQQGEATQASHGFSGKQLETNILSQISGVQEDSDHHRTSSADLVVTEKEVAQTEVKVEEEQEEGVAKKSLEAHHDERHERTSESAKEPIIESQETSDAQNKNDRDDEDEEANDEVDQSHYADPDYHLDSDTEHSEGVENFDSEGSKDSIASVKVKKRKYKKRRVERPPKRYTKKKKGKKALSKETPVEGKRKRGRPRKNTGPDSNIKCPDCDFIAKDRKSLYAHNRRAHLNVATNCNICGKLYPSLFDMKRHRILIHNPPKYCCDICGKRYKVNTSLKLHVKSHEPNYVKPVYPCSSCDKSFANPSLLRTHTRRKHEPESEFEREVREVKHFCYICHKTFSSKAALQEHTKIIHMRIYDHQCDQCGKVFGYEKSLATHKLIHSSAKNFVCKICGKAFKQKSCMTIHQAIHMEKKFLCGHCGRGFTQRQSLRRHEIIHRGEKPYSCKLCGQAFNSISTIRRHVILVHKLQKDSSVWREDINVDTELLASIKT